MHSHRLMIAVLALVCVTFAIIVMTELTNSTETGLQRSSLDISAAPILESATPQKANITLPALRSFSIVAERPLFSPSRRPVASMTDGSGDWSSFALVGIIITPQSRDILVVHGKPPAIVHLTEGQMVDGWTVKAIYRNYVVFNDQTNEHELKLIDKAAPSRPSTPQSPSAAPPTPRGGRTPPPKP